LLHTFGATKKEFSGRGGSLAPSVLCAGTIEGTCAETPCISVYYNHGAKKYYQFTEHQLKATLTSASAVAGGGSVWPAPAGSRGVSRARELTASSAASSSAACTHSAASPPVAPRRLS
jgi:hypothetical protein